MVSSQNAFSLTCGFDQPKEMKIELNHNGKMAKKTFQNTITNWIYTHTGGRQRQKSPEKTIGIELVAAMTPITI